MSLAVAAAEPSDAQRLKSLAVALDRVKRRVEAQMGQTDVRRVKRLNFLSRSLEVTGRVLIHFSLDPVTFAAGVTSLFLHKQLQATEIGHSALHGCYDGLEGAEKFHSERFSWDVPIDEEAWRYGHNIRHHMYTNVAGRDMDIRFGPVRLTSQTPHRWFHRFQLPYSMLVMWPAFTAGMNLHFSGVLDVTRGEADILPDLSPASKRKAFKTALRKYIPYYAKNYVLFPALAGPMFPKVLLGNWLAETLRDLYSAASILVGHVGEDVAFYDGGHGAGSKGAWYERQIRATHNFEVPYLLSVLCGGLDYQIEHHLFPKLPPERLRQIAPEVRAICEAHGVPYYATSWAGALRDTFSQIWNLSFPQPSEVTA